MSETDKESESTHRHRSFEELFGCEECAKRRKRLVEMRSGIVLKISEIREYLEGR